MMLLRIVSSVAFFWTQAKTSCSDFASAMILIPFTSLKFFYVPLRIPLVSWFEFASLYKDISHVTECNFFQQSGRIGRNQGTKTTRSLSGDSGFTTTTHAEWQVSAIITVFFKQVSTNP
jgi:hypothetical protein